MLASRNAASDFCFGNSAQRLLQPAKPLAHRIADPPSRRIIRRQQKHRQHENDEPDAGQRTRDAVALVGDGVKAEQRLQAEQRAPGFRTGGEKAEHQDQAQDAADIAGGPAGAGQSPDPVGRHQRRHHRIVEDGGEFGADGRKPIGEQQRRNHAGVAGLAEPHQARSRSPAARRTPRSRACAGRRHPRSRRAPATSARSAIPPPRWQSPTAIGRSAGSGATWVAK